MQTVQVGNCANSFTPFSGDSSSMPKGFYADGIFFMLLGAMGMVGSMFTHLVLAKGWRARAKAMKEVESDSEDAKEASDAEDEDEDEGDSDSDEEDNDDSSEAIEDGYPRKMNSEEEVDGMIRKMKATMRLMRSMMMLEQSDDEIDEEEFFGTIIEFDDEDELVTIKEDGTGDEITGYQDEMFLE